VFLKRMELKGSCCVLSYPPRKKRVLNVIVSYSPDEIHLVFSETPILREVFQCKVQRLEIRRALISRHLEPLLFPDL